MVEEAQTLDWGVMVVACCAANDRYPPKLVKMQVVVVEIKMQTYEIQRNA